MRYVTALETPWPPKDAVAVVGDGTGYTIYQAGDTIPTFLPGEESDFSPAADLESSFEYFGVRQGQSADLNVSRLQIAMDGAPGSKRLSILASPGKQYDFGGGDVYLRTKNITLAGNGEILNGTINVGALPPAAVAGDITGYAGGGSALAAAMRLFAEIKDLNFRATLGYTKPGVKLAYARDVSLQGLKAINHSSLVEAVGAASDNFSQTVARVKIDGCHSQSADIPIKLTKGAGNATMHFADWLIVGGYYLDTTGSADTPRTTYNVYAEGCDGLSIVGAYLFQSANGLAFSGKRQNIYVGQSTNIILTGLQLFEAGEEAILIDRCKTFSARSNIIAFPGQRVVSPGVRITGGDNSGGVYCVGTIGGNTFEGPTGDGIRIDAGCDYITVEPNAMAALGSSARFFGAGTPLGSNALAVSRAEARANTQIARQATDAQQIKRSMDVTTTGDNQTIEIGDAKVLYLKSASQLNVTSFTRFGVVPTDPEDSITLIGVTNATKLYTGTGAGRIATLDGVHWNVSTGDVIKLRIGTDSGTGVTRWYPEGVARIGRTKTVTTAGAAVAADIEDAQTVLLSAASTTSVASFTRNGKAMTSMSNQGDGFVVQATNGNTTLTYNATTMVIKNAVDVTLASGNSIKFEAWNGKLFETWRNF